MRLAIQTKIERRMGLPVQVIASYDNSSETYDYDPTKTLEENHIAAAQKTATKYYLFGAWHGGSLSADKYAFVRPTANGVPAFSVPYPED